MVRGQYKTQDRPAALPSFKQLGDLDYKQSEGKDCREEQEYFNTVLSGIPPSWIAMMKLFCLLLLLAGYTTAVPLEASGREKYTTLSSQDSTTASSPTEAKSRFAMLDDVRLLANGLLQLGQSLRDFVHKTKAQINDIFQKLNIFDRSFYQLSVVTSEIKEEEEELKKTTNFLKANNEEIKNMSLEINSKINSIVQERAQLQGKVGNLEEKLEGLSQSRVPADQINEITTLKVRYCYLLLQFLSSNCINHQSLNMYKESEQIKTEFSSNQLNNGNAFNQL